MARFGTRNGHLCNNVKTKRFRRNGVSMSQHTHTHNQSKANSYYTPKRGYIVNLHRRQPIIFMSYADQPDVTLVCAV